MSFLEARMDPCLSLGFRRVSAYQTQIVELDSGAEQRNANWSRARRTYSAEQFSVDRFELLDELHNAVKGAAHGFRFKDWLDFKATSASLGGAPGSGSAPILLFKTYTNGALNTVRVITKPVAGTVTVYVNGVAKPGTLDTATGLFTPSTAWSGGALTWSGQFDVPVRFASDELDAVIEDYSGDEPVVRCLVSVVELK